MEVRGEIIERLIGNYMEGIVVVLIIEYEKEWLVIIDLMEMRGKRGEMRKEIIKWKEIMIKIEIESYVEVRMMGWEKWMNIWILEKKGYERKIEGKNKEGKERGIERKNFMRGIGWRRDG